MASQAQQGTQSAPEIYDKAYATRALLVFSCFIVIVMYIETMLVPSLPSIAKEFNVSPAEVSLVLAMYLVSGVAFAPVVGKLADIYGKKKMLMYILPIYAVAVGVTGFSPNFTFMVCSRFIQGIGLTIMPLAMSLVREQFPRELVPRAQGMLGATFGIGAAIGLPLGAFISNTYGWQLTYHTALPFVIIFSIAIFLFIKESKYTRPKVDIDMIGALLLVVGLTLVVLAIANGDTWGWTSIYTLGSAIVGIILILFMARLEREGKEHILDFKLLKKRNVLVSNLAVFGVGLGFFMAYQAYAYEFELAAPTGYGFSIFDTGLSLVPFAAMMVVMAPLVGRLLSRYGAKPFMILGSIIAVIGFALSGIAPSATDLIIGATVAAAGFSMLNVAIVNVLVLSVENKEMGFATSSNLVFRILGSSVGAPIAGAIITVFFAAGKGAFTYLFAIAVIFFIAIGLISFKINEILGKNAKPIAGVS